MQLRNRLFTVLLSLSSVYIVSGQNIESLGKEKPLKINGGLSFNQMFYDATGSPSRRSPYTYYFNGNVSFNIYGVSVPFSYMFSNQQSSFQQPFNQYGLHPTYKWITTHIGYSSMTLSPYTLNGHQFLGVGVELTPGSKFRFSAMYGRLNKAIEYDTTNTISEPSYLRMAYGLKAGMNLGKSNIELITFKSKDVLHSINHNFDSVPVYPEENLAFGVNIMTSVIEKLKAQIEYGYSMITRDIRSDIASENLVFTTRTSTEKFKAIKAGLKYIETYFSLGISYERIDPGYRTHGSYYFNNDLENMTGNFTVSFFNKKLNLGGNIGIQRDDLEHKKMSSMVRLVNSYNIGFVPFNQLNITAAYSNFKSHTNVKSQFERINQLTTYDNLDTLNFTQISENTSLNVNYNISNTEKSKQYLSFNSTYQKASEYQDQVLNNSGAKFLNLNLGHNYTFTKTNTSLITAFNYSESKTSLVRTITVGPTIGIRKSFFKNKMRNSLSSSYNSSYSNGSLISSTTNIRINTGYTWQKKHNFSLNGTITSRNLKIASGDKKFTEFTATLGYSYNF